MMVRVICEPMWIECGVKWEPKWELIWSEVGAKMGANME